MNTETPAQRLGRYVRARRRELKMTQADVQRVDGPSTATLRLIEGGKHTDFRGGTGTALEAALKWKFGSIDATLSGGEPTPVLGLHRGLDAVPVSKTPPGSNQSHHEASSDAQSPADTRREDLAEPTDEEWFESEQAIVSQSWQHVRDLAAAITALDDAPEGLRDAGRRIIFAMSGFLIIRILGGRHATKLEPWLQRIYIEREQLFRAITVGEPKFPWRTAGQIEMENSDDVEVATESDASGEASEVEEVDARRQSDYDLAADRDVGQSEGRRLYEESRKRGEHSQVDPNAE